MKIFLFILVVFVFSTQSLIAGDKKAKDSDRNKFVNTDSLQIRILEELNKIRKEAQVDELEINEVLQNAAVMQAEDMVAQAKATTVNSSGKYKTTGKRVASYGGTQKADEIVIAVAGAKGKEHFGVEKIVEEIFAKWKNGKKEKPFIINGNYVFTGIAVREDPDGKKAYVSVVFGSYNTFNSGANKRKEMKVPYTKKQKGLKAPLNAKECKNCDKFKDYWALQQGVYVENGKIYLKYNNLKMLKKLLRKPKDGLAIDIVQKDAYKNAEYNIYDNNLVNKGVRLKTVYTSKLLSKNRIKDKKNKGIDVELGKMPKNISEPYELNLLVIQENKVCKTLMRSYLEQGDQESNTPLDMLLMPDSAAYFPLYKPEAENTILTFSIPFEKNKSDYKAEDVKPFLDAMQEPDFIIEGLYIYAYSSIEGDAGSNAKLQQKRAESIVKTFQGMQKDRQINTNIKTSDSWDLFRLENDEGKYADLAMMKKEEAIRKINTTPGLADELEPILSKERFAQIVMDITYDIKGPKEEKYCVATFNKAAKKDPKMAYKLQYFIEKSVREKKYTNEAVNTMQIEKTAANSGLLMNKVVYRYFEHDKVIGEEEYKELQELEKLDPANKYITFNSIFAEIKLDEKMPDKKAIADIQSKIDALYGGRIPKKFVDALNIEYQFKVIEAYDTLEEGGEPVIEEAINKIKGFYNFKEASWQNALKLSYVFMRFKDYKFAATLLEPYIETPKADEQLVFTYISLCAQTPEKIKSKMFVKAMTKASEINKDRYCKLFGDPYLTFQVMDNPNVKKDYSASGCAK